ACVEQGIGGAPPPMGSGLVPDSQQSQVTASEGFPSLPDFGSVGSKGSLKTSNTTAGFDLNVVATDCQKSTECASGIGCCSIATCAPGAVQCRSRIAYSPWALSAWT